VKRRREGVSERHHPTPEERDERVSLAPLDFETAVAGLLAVQPDNEGEDEHGPQGAVGEAEGASPEG
jgi:hypothetical protein